MKPKRSKMAGAIPEETQRTGALSYIKSHVNKIIGTPERQHASSRANDPSRSSSGDRPLPGDFQTSPSDHSTLPSPTCATPDMATRVLSKADGPSNRKQKGGTPFSSLAGTIPRSNDNSGSKTVITRPRQGSAVLKNGILYGLSDRNASEPNWKPFYVDLRGHKLYLYKVSSHHSLLSQFSSTTLPSTPTLTTPIAARFSGLNMASFHRETQPILTEMMGSYVHEGEFYKESNQEPVKLIIFGAALVLCGRQPTGRLWHMKQKLPLYHTRLDTDHTLLKDHDGCAFSMKLGSDKESFTCSSRDTMNAWIKAFDIAQKAHAQDESKDRETENVSGTDMSKVECTGKHKDLIVRGGENRKIQGGTVEALVHELLFQTQGNDDEFTDSFLLICSVVTTPGNILKDIRNYLEKATGATNIAQWKKLFYRVMDIFTVYCKRFALDVVGDVATGMILILNSVYAEASDEEMLQKRNQVKELVLSTIESNGQACSNRSSKWMDCETVEMIESASGETEERIDLTNIISTGLSTTLFLSIDPERFAEQIYLFHLSQHYVYQVELRSPLSYVPRPHASTQMLSSLLFTTAAPHFLTKVVRRHVLEQTNMHPENMSFATRTLLLEHWIRVGIRLAKLGDMTGWCAIATGICSIGVVRLRETWKSVDPELVHIVANDWAGRLVRHGLFTQEVWNPGWENEVARRFAEVLDADALGLRQTKETLSLPFFGTIRQTADRLRRHIQLDEKQIDFEKCRNLFDVIQGGLNAFKVAKGAEESSLRDSKSPPFTVVKILQTFFESLVTEPTAAPYSFKYLHECSLACEPRILLQRTESEKLFGNDVTPPPSSTLIFPEVLECYKLFDTGSVEAATVTSLKTHPRKKGSNNSMHSLHSFLDNDVQRKGTIISHNDKDTSDRATDDPGKPSDHLRRRRTYSFPPGRSRSFDATAASVAEETRSQDRFLAADHNKTWLGTLIAHGRRTSLLSAHREGGRKNGEWLLNLHHGELLLKASTLLQLDDRLNTIGNNPAKGFLDNSELDSLPASLQRKTEGSDKDNANEKHNSDATEQKTTYQPLLVNVKAGWLDRLVDVLVYGVNQYNYAVKEQWSILLQSVDPERQQLKLDTDEYMRVFFVTYRAFCSCADLLRMLLERFIKAKRDGSISKRKNLRSLETVFAPGNNIHPTDCYDWKKIAHTQLRVFQIVKYWIEHHFDDFVDEVELLDLVSDFMTNAQQALSDWRKPLLEKQKMKDNDDNDNDTENTVSCSTEALETAEHIEELMEKVRWYFIEKILSPCYDTKAIMYDVSGRRNMDSIYRQLTEGKLTFDTTLQQTASDMPTFSLSNTQRDVNAKSVVDTFSAVILLQQTDRSVRKLFTSVTLQEWIQTFDVLEAQSGDLYAWLPTGKSSYASNMTLSLSSVRDPPTAQQTSYHVAQEEVVVSDIFTAIEGARRSTISPSAFSADDLLLAFPASIQYLFCIHLIIKSWVVQEVTERGINCKTRGKRIEKFLQMLATSKSAGQKLALFPDLCEDNVKPNPVPGFVEYAVASGLLSPESRLFAKAWQDVANKHGHANLDTVESVLSHIKPITTLNDIKDDTLLVPSLGWIFDRMLELCVAMPNTYEGRKPMLSFDKRRYVFRLMQLIVHAQAELDKLKLATSTDTEVSLAFLVSPSAAKPSWKELKESASREHKSQSLAGSLVSRGSSKTQRAGIFCKLVGEELDKLKRNIKERDRVDKDWRYLQHKMQKRQVEQMKILGKQERKGKKILRMLRPYSMTTSSLGIFGDMHACTRSQLAVNKASTVVSLISSTTSEVDDDVFRVVTEEGGQYQFRSENRGEHLEWMRLISEVSREGTAKRQSVLAAESALANEETQNLQPPEPRKKIKGNMQSSGVYGQRLELLMPDNRIPIIADKCIREIEQRGLEEVGIYRVSGSGSEVNRLKLAFNKNADAVNLSDDAWADINVVGDAFKLFLRELPEPLLTHEKYDAFINASVEEDHDKRVNQMKKVIQELPVLNYIMLKRLIEHFVIVTEFEATNHMYATNLAIVFGPTLLQPAPGPASYVTTMSNLGRHQKIVQYLILEYHYLFDIEDDEHQRPPDKADDIDE